MCIKIVLHVYRLALQLYIVSLLRHQQYLKNVV